jgi:hypothetical protein
MGVLVMSKIAIVGSRYFQALDLVADYIRTWFKPGDILVSGGAFGVDAAAELIANNCSIESIIFRPNWYKYGKSAGAMRNRQIVETADRIVAFWDGTSKGTKITIDMAKKSGKPCEVILDA